MKVHWSNKCEICFKTFKSAQNLALHAAVHTDSRPFQCEICFKTFRNMRRHVKIHDRKRTYLECDICFQQFTRPSNLEWHRSKHKEKKENKCNICLRIFKRISDLNKHKSVHSKEKPFKCEHCPKAFKRRTTSSYISNLIIHCSILVTGAVI